MHPLSYEEAEKLGYGARMEQTYQDKQEHHGVKETGRIWSYFSSKGLYNNSFFPGVTRETLFFESKKLTKSCWCRSLHNTLGPELCVDTKNIHGISRFLQGLVSVISQ